MFQATRGNGLDPIGHPDHQSATRQDPGPLAFELTGLSKVYHRGKGTEVRAVDDLSLSVPVGQVVGLLGPNGAGKTTTIKMMCGLVTPTEGRVHLNGYDVARERPMAVRQVGAVLEGARNVYWSLSAWQNLLYFGHLKGLSRKMIVPRAESLLRSLDPWEQRHQAVGAYSRGMQQKVAIAAALITDPPILLLDEPTIGLDVQTARTVKDWIAKLAHEERKTIVLTTHQLALAQELSDRIVIIHQGRLLTDLPVRALLARFRQETYEIRLGSPLTSDSAPWLDGFSVTSADGESSIRGPISDQGRLYDLLTQVHAHHLPLLAVEPVEPNLEDVFVQILKEG
jgi:ABC-2 type transport system ATP-binding protein